MTPRVVVWATGRTGKALLRTVIADPDLELAGVLVYSDAKDGVDAGELVGLPRTGVITTTDKSAIAGLDADVVCMAPRGNNRDETLDRDVLTLLEAGKNVISTRGYHYPMVVDADYARIFDDAGKAGGATLLGIGNNPGFVGERLLTTLTGGCLSVSALSLVETYDCSHIDASTAGRMGFGASPGEFRAEAIVPAYEFLYSHTLHFVCAQLGKSVQGMHTHAEATATEVALEGLSVPVRAGTVRAIHLRFTAVVDDRDFFTMENRWFVGEPPAGWDRDTGWTLRTAGEPPFVLRLNYDGVTPDVGSKAFLPALFRNAIPVVVAAAPGLLLPTVFAPFAVDQRSLV
ncbi:hypothetical protein [[Mycobacterium] vasticus]|uniref:Dihydrodipicolinate reductase n=1 Tax=[Mycobacterium] vasticus TaxID=2875777 RepID=A0ABU5Z0Y5_9MYCO|nr:hypothetical protein [Mycolicibacter sp. MYC017]MEB3070289.1 hypothetical protein [Mycolicibacter sp. MYC017]